jgi:hypothetical protein
VRRRGFLQVCGSALATLALRPRQARAQGTDAPSAAEQAAGVVPRNYAYPPLNVLRYGAVGDGVTDDGAAIRAAWRVARQQGGGTVIFPGAVTYLISSLDPASPVRLPQQQSGGSILYQPYQTQLYFQNGDNVVFDFQGSTLKSSLTGGGVFILLDGCSSVRLLGARIIGTQLMSSGATAFGDISGGSGYANGTYRNVLLKGGSGGGAVADLVVSGGAVSSITPVYPGGSYAVGDTLTCNNADVGGRGGGFSAPLTSVSGAGPKVAVAAPVAVACTALSCSSANIIISDLDVDSMYAALYVVSDPNSPKTVTQVTVAGHTRSRNCEYGVALHNGGDDSRIENLYTYRVDRPFFFYGVENVKINCIGDQTNFGFAPLVKAYSRSTRNISIRYSAINQPGQSHMVAKISFQVQHDPAVIEPPPTVQSVQLDYDESNVSSGGFGIEFDYFAGPGGGTQQSGSSRQLFNNFVIRGATSNMLLTTVALNTAAAQCQIDVERLQFRKPKADNELSTNGFRNGR